MSIGAVALTSQVSVSIQSHNNYLRAAAPAADPGKEKPVMVSAGFVRVFCESSAWMLYIYIIYIYASNSIYLYVEVKFC